MARLPLPKHGELPPDARRLYDRLVAERGRIDGMYQTLLVHPDLLERVSALGGYLRFEGTDLPPQARELAILACARSMGAAYIWVKHAQHARQAGIPDDVIEDLREGREPGGLDPALSGVLEAARCALGRRSILKQTQDAIEKAYGVKGVVELVVLCGFYAMIAGVISAFEISLPEGASLPFASGRGEKDPGGGRGT
ncbi:carboxymuconolactone decarboxylase family protein [Desulfolutivibrio sulfoxidireducens]|uniref:carboxymuconolactone decarboxylase family protein n=1 Tax=Desulfolutivibrio sulfoxidireducens TaxID=2773299 RepID=UPI00159DE9B7|nr:carboxymuconolactone decarboxylase family protein [Desulfolutivibrio sulfoxidireducens]QLA16148.1 carboxymuconolactone decarboxylase family protein [Desulfolutivibrio sulfoxidireducens]QLA19955.1 carboxymuconolactone decarboxylase family protein [Desulfolutivibrio sulfoxidireducens]